MVRIAEVDLPSFGAEETCPAIPVEVYQARLAAAADRMTRAGLDCLVVYGDREHSANLAYLTGFDPRFEESILLLDAGGRKALLVGNECMGYLPDERLGLEVVLFQDFSLMGQPRGDSRPLREILAGFGVRAGLAVGCAGWKTYTPGLVEGGDRAIDAPAYLVDLLRELAGGAGSVRNAVGLFAEEQDGLRLTNEPEQLAFFEYAAARTSGGVRNVLANLREGAVEQDLARFLEPGPLTQSCHPIVGFGEKVKRGLSSPSANRAKLGDACTVGFGLAGSLTCRAGAVARSAQDLPPALREFYPAYAANYFGVVAAWYAAIRVGAVAGDVYQAAEAARDGRLYRFAVNPGHYIHLDEWVHSPFSPGSRVTLRSGMAIQMDIIPVSAGPFCFSNAEDGIVLADAALRAELAQRYPAMWKRIQARREFMQRRLGLKIDESLLPLSNMPAWLPPYALDTRKVFTQE